MKTVLIIYLTLCQLSFAHANCGEKKTVLFFANGMFNSWADANKSLDELSIKMKRKYPQNKFDAFKVAYNTNEPVLLQLHQVFRQKITDTNISFWRNIEKLLELEKDEALKNVTRLLRAEQVLTDQDLRRQISDYKKYLKNDFKIITVAHSQGNLYTNFSFDSIGSDETQMISVATPASDVYGEGPYFTFFSDGVIARIPNALPANRKKQQSKYFDHEFIGHYLGDYPTENEILSAIDASYNSKVEGSSRSLSPQDGYFNSDMAEVLKWFQVYLKEKRKLSKSECLIVEGLFSVYALHGLSCEGRNFNTFHEIIDDCENYFNGKHPKETLCPHYQRMDFIKPYYPSSESLDHYALNPHCDMDLEEFKKSGRDQVNGAKSIYKTFIKGH